MQGAWATCLDASRPTVCKHIVCCPRDARVDTAAKEPINQHYYLHSQLLRGDDYHELRALHVIRDNTQSFLDSTADE